MNFPVVEAKRKKGETFESLYRRFGKRLQQSGNLFLARKLRYKERNQSRNEVKKITLFKRNQRAKTKQLIRSGKVKDEPERRSYHKR